MNYRELRKPAAFIFGGIAAQCIGWLLMLITSNGGKCWTWLVSNDEMRAAFRPRIFFFWAAWIGFYFLFERVTRERKKA